MKKAKKHKKNARLHVTRSTKKSAFSPFGVQKTWNLKKFFIFCEKPDFHFWTFLAKTSTFRPCVLRNSKYAIFDFLIFRPSKSSFSLRGNLQVFRKFSLLFLKCIFELFWATFRPPFELFLTSVKGQLSKKAMCTLKKQSAKLSEFLTKKAKISIIFQVFSLCPAV